MKPHMAAVVSQQHWDEFKDMGTWWHWVVMILMASMD
jgi:hypothetical protein